MPNVRVKENEPFDVALRRFKRSCEKAGILAEVRKREFYEKPTAIRKRKAAAVKNERKADELRLLRERRRTRRQRALTTLANATTPIHLTHQPRSVESIF